MRPLISEEQSRGFGTHCAGVGPSDTKSLGSASTRDSISIFGEKAFQASRLPTSTGTHDSADCRRLSGSPIERTVLPNLPASSAAIWFFSTLPRHLAKASNTTPTRRAYNIGSQFARERLCLFRDRWDSLYRGQLCHLHHHE